MLSLKKISATFLLLPFLISPNLSYAWTEPSVAAPDQNVAAPINVGSVNQSKNAVISATGFTSSGSIVATGAVQGSQICIGTICKNAWPSGISGANSGVANYIAKWTAANTIDNSILIYDNGTNVGIGTATPGYKLDINGGLNVNGDIKLNSDIYSTASYIGFLNGNSAEPIKAGSLAISNTYATNAPINGLYVQGNVGIGVTSPIAKLDVKGDGNFSGGVYADFFSASKMEAGGGAVQFLANSAGIDLTGANQIKFLDGSYQTTANPKTCRWTAQAATCNGSGSVDNICGADEIMTGVRYYPGGGACGRLNNQLDIRCCKLH